MFLFWLFHMFILKFALFICSRYKFRFQVFYHCFNFCQISIPIVYKFPYLLITAIFPIGAFSQMLRMPRPDAVTKSPKVHRRQIASEASQLKIQRFKKLSDRVFFGQLRRNITESNRSFI